MDVEDCQQQEALLSGGVKRQGNTSTFGRSSTLKMSMLVTSMIVLVAILCTVVAGVAFLAGTRHNNSQEEEGEIVVLGPSHVHDPARTIRAAPTSNTCNSSKDTCEVPAAHIVGGMPGFYEGDIPTEVTSGDGNQIPMLPINMHWQGQCSGDTGGVVQGGMRLTDGGYLVVPRTGLYYVYSQLRLVDQRTNKLFPIGGSLLKLNVGSRQWRVILETAVPTTSIEKAEASSYHAGVFNLTAGDRLGVQVNRYRHLNGHVRVKLVATRSYFGTYMLSKFHCDKDHAGS